LLLVVFGVAAASRIPAFDSWWCLDDWGQIGKSIGLLKYEFGARSLSQYGWWKATWALGEMNPHLQTGFRIIVHGFSAVAVVRIASLLGEAQVGQAFSGLFFAASPIAFTPIYWASGIQELLGAFFALWAMNFWLRAGAGGAILGFACAVLSILSKESGLGLPLPFFVVLLVMRPVTPREQKMRIVLIFSLLAAAALESALLLRHFSTGSGEPYEVAWGWLIPGNLGLYGWWLLTLGPVFASKITVSMVLLGGAMFAAWGGYCLILLRKKDIAPLFLFLVAVLALTPSLPLVNQTHPYLAYLTVAMLALTIGGLLPRRRNSVLLIASLATWATVWGYWNTAERIRNVGERGRIADPVVRAAHLARDSAKTLLILSKVSPGAGSRRYILLQPPISKKEVAEAEFFGARKIVESPRYAALGGQIGPTLILGPRASVLWVNSLVATDIDAAVYCETGRGFLDWGGVWSGLLYSAILDISLGHFDRAARELDRAAEMDSSFNNFFYDPRKVSGISNRLRTNGEAFERWLDASPAGAHADIDLVRVRRSYQLLKIAVSL
jgi:hypothetical protein